MGICSAIGFVGVGAVKIYAFDWSDVPVYWLFAGLTVVLVMGVLVWRQHARRKREEEEQLERVQLRQEAMERRRAARADAAEQVTDQP